MQPTQSPPLPDASASAQPQWQTPFYDRQAYSGPVFTYAAFWPRFGAWLLDLLFSLLIAAIPAVILAVVLALAVSSSQEEAFTSFEEDQQNEDIALAAVGGAVLGYFPVYLAYHTIANAKGGGWGKRIVGLRVLRERDGELPGYGTGFLRIFITMVMGAVNLVQLLDYLWCIWDAQKQTWHDKISGTVVVAVS
jgi:uncharacterized RDD family membrane protein YckC